MVLAMDLLVKVVGIAVPVPDLVVRVVNLAVM